MKVSKCVACKGFPCCDVQPQYCYVPDIDVDPEAVSIILISEAAAAEPQNNYYSNAVSSLFQETTVQAFSDAGAHVKSVKDILDLGVYLTTAVKCPKVEYGISARTIEQCSHLLERELALFPNAKAFLLMGDVAIKAVNCIARRVGKQRAIPAGSTYKIRGQAHFFQGRRAFPSYLQAGPSFYIEKSKRRMIAEDIAAALKLATQQAARSRARTRTT